MIISHKYQFIFVRTEKTASTSLENALYPFLDDGDVCSGLVEGNIAEGLPPNPPLNHRGFINPFCDCRAELPAGENWRLLRDNLTRLRKRLKFHRPHMPAWMIRNRLPESVWRDYFVFCFDRNPYDKVVSHYFHVRGKVAGLADMSFDEYVRRGKFPRNYPKYTDQLTQSELIVDHVARYEDMDAELLQIAERLALPSPIELGRKLKGGFRPQRDTGYREMIGPAHKAILDEVFAPELAFHGYRF